jgi:hypothetical protein
MLACHHSTLKHVSKTMKIYLIQFDVNSVWANNNIKEYIHMNNKIKISFKILYVPGDTHYAPIMENEKKRNKNAKGVN